MEITLSDTSKDTYDITSLFDMNNIYQDDYSFNSAFWQNILHLTRVRFLENCTIVECNF